MFRKIVTELAYSPALAGSLGSYIKKLRDERSKRQIGLIFIFLAVALQIFAALFPPESANANNPSAFIDGGIQSIDEYINYYSQNTKNIKDLLTSLGITQSDLEGAKQDALPSTEKASLWLMQNSRDGHNVAYSFRTSSGAIDIAFYRPLNVQGNIPDVFVGKISQSNTWFAITKDSGNLITEANSAANCPSGFSTAIDSRSIIVCPPSLEPSLSARTIGASAAPDIAHASDRIAYTLTVTNRSNAEAVTTPAINLEDILEYSRILDYGGGEYDYDTKMLSWPTTTLATGSSTERSFIVQLLPTIPSTAQGEYTRASYDCSTQVVFGNTIDIPVSCPFVKHIEQLTNNFIGISRKTNFIFAICLLILSSYLYVRSRQLFTELYIIRHNHLGGL